MESVIYHKNKVFAGLTGGIACGKSAVADILLQCGAYIIDADVLARKVVEINGAAYAKVCDAFSNCVFKGVIDRYKLKERVFNNNADLKLLNSITHPIIKNEAFFEAENCKQDIIIFVVPLLFETGYNVFTSPNITINCPKEMRIERLIKRDNITKELACKIIATQLTDEQRSQKADIILNNNGDFLELEAQVVSLYKTLKKGKEAN